MIVIAGRASRHVAAHPSQRPLSPHTAHHIAAPMRRRTLQAGRLRSGLDVDPV